MSGFDSRQFRNVLGRFATGVTVVTTAAADGTPLGVTVNSFTSVSLDPPLVLFCLERDAFCRPAFERASHFAVNILGSGQRALSDRFAEPSQDKWNDLEFRTGDHGCPLLPGTLGALECERHAMHDGGDHVILIGRVVSLDANSGSPLVYFRGAYTALNDRDGRSSS